MFKKIFLFLFLIAFIFLNFGCFKKVEEEPLLKNDVVIGYGSNFEDEVLNVKDKYVFVVFYEPKCHWCKSQVDALEIFKNDREIGNKIKIVKINVEEEPFFMEKYNLEVPLAHLLFYNGEILYRNVGYVDSPHLNQYLKPYVKFDERQ